MKLPLVNRRRHYPNIDERSETVVIKLMSSKLLIVMYTTANHSPPRGDFNRVALLKFRF
jgi:hypothetical protein